jgi:hypothetical protein
LITKNIKYWFRNSARKKWEKIVIGNLLLSSALFRQAAPKCPLSDIFQWMLELAPLLIQQMLLNDIDNVIESSIMFI